MEQSSQQTENPLTCYAPGAFAVPARQCIQRPQVRIFIRKALWQAAGSNLQTLGSRGFLFLLPPFLSLFAPFKRERKGLFVHLQV